MTIRKSEMLKLAVGLLVDLLKNIMCDSSSIIIRGFDKPFLEVKSLRMDYVALL